MRANELYRVAAATARSGSGGRTVAWARACRFYVTTPIYYVNAAPHLGHAYTTIAADVMARHHRQRGEEVFFLTGTDEHGEPVADAAHALGIEPQELADRNAERFKALAPLIEASNDFFIRTTDPQHMAQVQEVLARVRENGYVYEGTYEGWYCPRCADFKAENEIDEGNRCPIHHIELTREQEDSYFFKLSAFQERLAAPVRRARGLRRAAHALQRGALVHPLGAARRAADAPPADLGRAGAVGRRARLLRLVRRAAELLHGALLRARPDDAPGSAT